ncbi:hypothetical protein [Candidatus Symbiobacter mobilis]|uniref:Uncharacterized protein n=1 Tax=Candidatus Symbiobacter mobilis CR TaxID=946483 RepID=U5N8T3_9BURK|nr:hypothetical protein [Candidatus Symbiobacter mobilis]AGX87730.1 hypothetical protein Cenrod_1645 [Candidatus Symbiobacter mobilis CR]
MGNCHQSSPYWAWLGCLYAIGLKIRREGLLAIEEDIVHPHQEDSLFGKYPLTRKQPYLDFACDTLRMMVDGMAQHSGRIDLYLDNAVRANRRQWFWRRANENLLQLIAITLRMLSDGHHPNIACEFGRQAIPFAQRPTFDDMGAWLKEQRASSRIPLSKERIAAFLQSIGADGTDVQ